jgi:hypothetical protein
MSNNRSTAEKWLLAVRVCGLFLFWFGVITVFVVHEPSGKKLAGYLNNYAEHTTNQIREA